MVVETRRIFSFYVELYFVFIERRGGIIIKSYYVNVKEVEKKIGAYDVNVPCQESSEKECFEIIEKEYEHYFERGNKVDNKINIIFAYTGILFLFIMDLFKIRGFITVPNNGAELVKIVVYCLVAIIILMLYLYSIFLLVFAIIPVKFRRFNPMILIEKNLIKEKPEVVYKFLSVKYCAVIADNHDLIDSQSRKLRTAIIVETVMVCIAIALYIFKYNFF